MMLLLGWWVDGGLQYTIGGGNHPVKDKNSDTHVLPRLSSFLCCKALRPRFCPTPQSSRTHARARPAASHLIPVRSPASFDGPIGAPSLSLSLYYVLFLYPPPTHTHGPHCSPSVCPSLALRLWRWGPGLSSSFTRLHCFRVIPHTAQITKAETHTRAHTHVFFAGVGAAPTRGGVICMALACRCRRPFVALASESPPPHTPLHLPTLLVPCCSKNRTGLPPPLLTLGSSPISLSLSPVQSVKSGGLPPRLIPGCGLASLHPPPGGREKGRTNAHTHHHSVQT